MADLVIQSPKGLYCEAGGFYIDPWRPVDKALITHAHSDHARYGHAHYLAAHGAHDILRTRLGKIALETMPYGQHRHINGVKVSFHPAGHVLGSAQIRLEHKGEVWVVSGDYKLDADPTCIPFEPITCHTFITESTFGLPVYRWTPSEEIYRQVNSWWSANAANGVASVLYGYSFGKAQRLLAGVDPSIGPIVAHGAVQALNVAYCEQGIRIPNTTLVSDFSDKASLKRALVIAPPSAAGSTWLKRFEPYSDAFASGWMLLRGARRRRALDRGFVMSDHADWPSLQTAIKATRASRVIVTHGYVDVLVRWLNEQGLQAGAFQTEYGEAHEAAEPEAAE